jgi:hypothetical protein
MSDYGADKFMVDVCGLLIIVFYLATQINGNTRGAIPESVFYTGVALVAGRQFARKLRLK